MCARKVLKKNSDEIEEATIQQKKSSTRFNRKTAAHADDQMTERFNKIHLLLGRQHSMNCSLIYTKTLQCKMLRENCSAMNKRYDSILRLAHQSTKTWIRQLSTEHNYHIEGSRGGATKNKLSHIYNFHFLIEVIPMCLIGILKIIK